MKFGLAGCGTISTFYGDAVAEIESAAITHVWDLIPERGVAFAEKYGTKVCGSYTEMLYSGIDAVCICTPSGLHAEQAVEAAEAGIHIVCEKPIGITPEQLDAIEAACEKSSVRFCAIAQLLLSEGVQKVKVCVEEGRLGRLILGDLSMKYYRTPEYYRDGGWRGTWKMDGGGALMNQGIHGISMLLHLMGPVKRVTAHTRAQIHDIEVEDTAVAILEFQNGAVATVTGTTSVQPAQPRRLELHGTKGSVQLTENHITRWDVESETADIASDSPDTNGASSDPTAFSHGLHRLQLEDFIQAVEEGREPFLNQITGREAVDLILAIYQSSRTGQPVELP